MAPWPCFSSTPFLDVYLWNGSCVEGCRISKKKQQTKLNIDFELSFLALVAVCKRPVCTSEMVMIGKASFSCWDLFIGMNDGDRS